MARTIALLSTFLLVIMFAPGADAGGRDRPSAQAGAFYPDDPVRLAAAVEAFLGDARPADNEAPVGIIAPHAGYIYSGQIAADAWNQAAAFDYDLVVILGTNHTTAGFDGVSVYDGDGYRTPLGTAAIDRKVTDTLLAAPAGAIFDARVHAREHSVEVQVPFAQVLWPEAKLVAAVVGTADATRCARFGRALAAACEGRRVLFVASCDLSHYPCGDDAREVDSAVLRALTAEVPTRAGGRLQQEIRRQLGRGVPGLSTCACGEAPVLVLLAAAAEAGATRSRVVSYANSADAVIGDPQRAVGYAAVALTKGLGPNDRAGLEPPAEPGPANRLSEEGRRELLAFARETIDRYLRTDTAPLPRDFETAAYRKQGAFVTLKKEGILRGCIGHMAEDRPLCRVVGSMALQAAFNDRRFSPLRADELADVNIEISVLTPFAPVDGPEAIRVGRDGVVLRKGGRSAVFLPQVAVEQGWSRDEMLDQLCRKAGLPAGAWRSGAQLLTFQAEVFGEHAP